MTLYITIPKREIAGKERQVIEFVEKLLPYALKHDVKARYHCSFEVSSFLKLNSISQEEKENPKKLKDHGIDFEDPPKKVPMWE